LYTTENWDSMVDNGVGSTHTVKPISMTEDTATVVFIKRRDRDRYGEAYEGDNECFLIFQVGNRFFKQKFGESSYHDDEFYFYDAPEEVFGEVKTVITFVPKED
jgi:hypothetical protein